MAARGPARAQLIVLNGGSSSGKTTIARMLQAILPDPWLRLGIDDLLDALPPSLMESREGIAFTDDGAITLGPGFREIQRAWLDGIVAMVGAGARVIFEDVFLEGGAGQARLNEHVGDVPVLWVAVRCDADVAATRERERKDRSIGMAAAQARIVHDGVTYDVEVDTSTTPAPACAAAIAELI
jgi:chloramphenicol 3-O phosphotransferase